MAKHIFVQSEEMKRRVVGRGIAAKKMTVVPMGIDLEAYSAEKIMSAPDCFYRGRRAIIYVGDISPVRKMDVVGQAIAKVVAEQPDLIFVVVGGAEAQDVETLKSEFRLLHIEDRIFFVGKLPLVDALGHVKRANLCIASCPNSPLLSVGTPTKLIEYVAMGGRVVANHHPDQDEVAKNISSIVACNFSVDGFVAAIKLGLNLGQPTVQEAKAARKWVAENRDYMMLSKRVEVAYNGILDMANQQ